MESESPADWLRHGQALEARGTADALNEAVRCYDRAITLLRVQPVDEVRRELAIAWMNFGNARQKQTDITAATDAVRAYDDALALLSVIASQDDFALCNTMGAAWMNRGHALHRQGTAATLAAALDSHDRAIAQLQTLPLDENRSFRINLAAAWMNRAHALLSFAPPDSAEAHEAATKAIELTASEKRLDPVIADIALRAHHTLCAALSHQLSTARGPELIAKIGDIIDDALALVRLWEKNGISNFRPLATAIFHFGAQFYHAHQPQFLTEFLLEAVDPTSSTGILFESAELRAGATAAFAQARADTYNRCLLNPGDERLAQLRQELEAAENRVAELRLPQSASGVVP